MGDDLRTTELANDLLRTINKHLQRGDIASDELMGALMGVMIHTVGSLWPDDMEDKIPALQAAIVDAVKVERKFMTGRLSAGTAD